MTDQLKAEHIEVATDATGKVWVNVDGVCVLRVGQVATLQLRFDDNQYVSKGKNGIFIQKRHTSENCWCGKDHNRHLCVKQARPYIVRKDQP